MVKDLCENALSEIGTYKSLKKDLLVTKLDETKENLQKIVDMFPDFYRMEQKLKDLKDLGD